MDTSEPVDSRRMCFQQGKAYVYLSDDDAEVVTEMPNGVVARHRLADHTVVRT